MPIVVTAAALFLCLHLAVAHDTALQIGGDVDTKLFLSYLMDRLENHIGEIVFVKSTAKFLLGGAFVCFVMWAYYFTTRRKLITGKEYGTAQWATEKAIAHLSAEKLCEKEIKKLNPKLNQSERARATRKIKKKYEDADMLFTDSEKVCMHNYELNNNTLIIGGAGSGKTRGFVMPNILQAHSSYVITDPKGEILEKSGHFLEVEKHYKIRVLNLDEKELSCGYNPFHYVHRDRSGWEERVLSLIETIIINTDGGEKKGGSDPFWDKAERLFLQAIFFAVVESFPPEEANMNTVMELIGLLKIEEERDNFDSDLDVFFEIFKENVGESHIGYQQFKEFRQKAGGKTAKSIVISAVARLAPFKVSEIRRIFAKDEMHLDLVGEEKTAVFVVVPPTDKTYNFIAGMLFTQLFQELNYCALNVHKHDGGRLPIPCRFILDEFANTCTIPNFVSLLAYARSLGIGITTILQSLEQIKNMYKDEWGVIVDNSNTLLYLGKVTHMDTLEYLSKLLGKGTFDKESSSRSRGGQGSSSVSRDRLGRELLDPSEIRKIDNNKCLFFVGGKDPFYSKKYNYQRHKNYRFTSDANKEFSYCAKRSGDETQVISIPEKKRGYAFVSAILDPKATEDYISANMLNFDFDTDDLLIVNDGELEEIARWEGYSDDDIKRLPISDIDTAFSVERTLQFITDNLLQLDFDSDDLLIVNDGENAELPHGEDVPTKKLGVNFDEPKMADFLTNNFFNLDFDTDNLLIVNDGELQDLVLLQSLLTPKERREAKKALATAATLVDIAENIDAYDFDDVLVNDGEVIAKSEIVEIFEEESDDSDAILAEIQSDAMLMKEDMLALSKLLDEDSSES